MISYKSYRKTAMQLLLVILTCLTTAASSSSILLVTVQHGSHVLEKTALGETLMSRGHKIYIAISNRYPKRASIDKLGIQAITYRLPEDVMVGSSEEAEKMVAEKIFSSESRIESSRRVSEMTQRDCDYMMRDEVFLKTVRDLKFDLMVTEPFIFSPCTMVLPAHLGVPFISLTSFYRPWEIRSPSLPSFVSLGPPILSEKAAGMSIWEKLIHFGSYLVIHNLEFALPALRNTTLLELYAPSFGSWSELLLKSQLFLIESDYHLGTHRPFMPNQIDVAGLTASPAKPLPETLEKLASESGKHGVILVSFGSTAYYMPDAVIERFLEAFSKLNQIVFARLGVPKSVKIPKNVKILSWLPQNDILGHPKTRLFITHCGNNGQYEALYHGVPMLGFPLYAEQSVNCQRAVDKGFGLQMNVHDFTAEELVKNINEVLNEDRFVKKIKLVSEMWKDEPTTPRQRAWYWIEHVIKYGGGHLRGPAMSMPMYQFLMLDVFFVCAVVGTLSLIVTSLCLRALCRRFRKRSESYSGKKLQ